MKDNSKISVVIPVYGCSSLLEELTQRLDTVLEEITSDYEIIMVNDASPDNAWTAISSLCNSDKRLKGINFSRNFGQHYAITAGLEFCEGDFIVVMDCDLQDRPEEIPKLFQKTKEDFDIILAQRHIRKDKFFKRLSSLLFYKVFGYLTNTKLDNSVANFGVYSKKVIHSFLRMNDSTRFFPTMIQWVGFNKCYVPIEHGERTEGESSYSFRTLMKLASNNIIAFSDKPLHLTVRFGFLMSIFSFLIGVVYLFKYFTGSITQLGYTSLILSIWFLSGIIILILGVLGLYIGKTFDKVKDRPNYILSKTINIEINDND